MKINKRLFFIGLLLPLLFTGCLKDSEDPKEDQTIILFGEEDYVKDFVEVFGVMPDDSIFNVEEAINPPDVRGEYEFADVELFYPSGAFDAPQDPIYFRFGGDYEHYSDYLHGQNHMIVHCDIKIPGLALNSEVFHSEIAYVKGSGQQFTVYLEREQEVHMPLDNTVVYYVVHQGIAISGQRCVDGNGDPGDIRNCRIALYNKDVQVTNSGSVPAEIVDAITQLKGQLTVYQDADSLTVMNTGNEPYINWDE